MTLGSFDRLRTYIWNTRRSIWDESPVKIIQNFYTVTALAWKRDGSKVTCAGFTGAVMLFESGKFLYRVTENIIAKTKFLKFIVTEGFEIFKQGNVNIINNTQKFKHKISCFSFETNRLERQI